VVSNKKFTRISHLLNGGITASNFGVCYGDADVMDVLLPGNDAGVADSAVKLMWCYWK
jgi:hypothetical protein